MLQIPIHANEEEENCKDDELRVPSPPPRRLSRSSIDLREMEHNCDKISQVHDSSSSIFPLKLENYLRYSGSEPLGGKYAPKQQSARELNTKSSYKSNNFFQPFFTKANLIKSGSVKSRDSVRDNQHAKFSYNNLNNSNINNNNSIPNKGSAGSFRHNSNNFINNNLKQSSSSSAAAVNKKRHIAASESDFLTMRGNGVPGTSRSNCHQTALKHRGDGGGTKQSKHQNLIYALSDSDFLSWNFRGSDYCKITNNAKTTSSDTNETAIFNKADLLKIILGKGIGAEYRNLHDKPPDILSGKLREIIFILFQMCLGFFVGRCGV